MKNVYVVCPRHRARRAFTLIELLVVIAIIAMLAAVSSRIIGAVSSSQQKSRAVAELYALGTGLEAFKSMYNDYPRVNYKNDKSTPQMLYKCLTGITFMNIENKQIVFRDMGSTGNLKTFVDPSSVTVGKGSVYDIESLRSDADKEKIENEAKKDAEKNAKPKGANSKKADADKPKSAPAETLVAETTSFDDTKSCFMDPWGMPYLYFYNSSLTIGSVGSWDGTSYILLTAGPDNEHVEVRSMYSSGVMPDNDTYRDTPGVVNDRPGFPNVDNLIYGYDD